MLKTIKISNINTQYFLHNPEGHKTMVLLHGLRGDHRSLSNLAKEFKDYKIIIPDLPGHGGSDELDSHSLASYSKWLRGFLGELGIKKTVAVGHSLGANILMATLKEDKGEMIDKAILFILYPQYHPSGFNKLLKGMYGIGKKLPANMARRILHSKTVSYLSVRTLIKTKNKKDIKFIIEDNHRSARMVSRKVVTEVFEELGSKSMRNYADSSVPQLFLITSEDNFSHNEEIKFISKLVKKAELVELEELGHLAPLEDPKRLAKAIEHWL